MSRVKTYQHYQDEAVQYNVDWSVRVGKLSTSVSSVVWSVESGSAAVSGEALAANVASALVTTSSIDCSLIKVKATFADGQIDVHFFSTRVDEPTCITTNSSNRY